MLKEMLKFAELLSIVPWQMAATFVCPFAWPKPPVVSKQKSLTRMKVLGDRGRNLVNIGSLIVHHPKSPYITNLCISSL